MKQGATAPVRPKRPQSFLHSSKSRTLNHREIAALTEEQALERFKAIRFAENDGQPFCPHCGCVAVYTYESRPIFKCKGCFKQFSLTSGTVFAHRKMSMSDILYAIAEFIEGAKGVSAMYLQRKLRCQYKTAWVLTHKLREAMSRDIGTEPLTGIVEIDGTWIGGYLRPKNARKTKTAETLKQRRNARKLPSNAGKKKLCVVVARERGPHGRIRTAIRANETEAKPFIRETISKNATLFSDMATDYSDLVWNFAEYRQINHSEFYYTPDCDTNLAENYFSMLKRGMRGVYHHISHPDYAHAYSEEAAWRLTNKGVPNLEKFNALVGRVALPGTTKFRGVWQRRKRKREALN